MFKLANLKRSTQSTSFIPEIDGLRFFAIITVLLYHLNSAYAKQIGLASYGLMELGGSANMGNAGWWMVRLDMGVKVFFAISGFILAIPFLKSMRYNSVHISVKDYFYRRLTRLEPPFIISLVVFFIFHVVVLGTPASLLTPHLFSGLIYSHGLIYGYSNPINPVTWSLETEFQFYLIVPLFFLILKQIKSLSLRYTSIISLFILSIFIKEGIADNKILQLNTSLLFYLGNFLTGILFAMIYTFNKEKWFVTKNLLYDFTGFIGLFLLFYFYKPQAYWLNNILFNGGIFLLMVSTFKGFAFNWFFTRQVVYIIGGMCYSIYLLHYAFFHWLVQYTDQFTLGYGYKTDYLLQIILLVPPMLFVSGLFFIWVEKPCMNKHWPQNLRTYIKKNII